MDIQLFEKFICLYEERNMTVAADRLFISRQALSKSIHQMEQELGCKLVISTQKGVDFTPVADYLYQKAVPTVSAFRKVIREVQDMGNQSTRTLHIGVDYMTTYIWDSDTLSRFTNHHPDLKIETTIMPPDGLEQLYRQNKFDYAISHMRVSQKDAILPVAKIPFKVLLLKTDPLRKKGFIVSSDLKKRECFATGGNQLFVDECNAFFKENGFDITIHTTDTNELFTNLEFIRKKKALFLTTGYYIDILTGHPDFDLVPFHCDEKSLPNHDVFLYCPSEVQATPLTNEFLSFLKKNSSKVDEINSK